MIQKTVVIFALLVDVAEAIEAEDEIMLLLVMKMKKEKRFHFLHFNFYVMAHYFLVFYFP
jgi:hypothetical protein